LLARAREQLLKKLTGNDIFEVLGSNLARPIGMQDFEHAKQRKFSSMPESIHPEYAMISRPGI